MISWEIYIRFDYIIYKLCMKSNIHFKTFILFLGCDMINGGKDLKLKGLGYKYMAGTYKCTVTGVGGQSSGSSALEVYCKYYNALFLF